jgi:hypothetical protein
VITALDKDDAFLNFLNMSAVAVDPNLEDFEVQIDQVAPGRYVGEFAVDQAGSYFINVVPGPGYAPILTGVSVPYSSEFRDRETNVTLLQNLAKLQPKEGEPGKVIDGEMRRDSLDDLLQVNTFRHNLAKAVSSQDIWPILVVLTACLFFGDVFIRRVTVHFYWIGPAFRWLVDRVFRREREEVADDRMERLRSRKAEIAGQIDVRRAAARFEPEADDTADRAAKDLDDVLAEAAGGGADAAPRPPGPQTETAAEDEQQSYTGRLLEAKKKAWKDKQA